MKLARRSSQNITLEAIKPNDNVKILTQKLIDHDNLSSCLQTRMSARSLEAQCVVHGAVRTPLAPTGASCNVSLAVLRETVVSVLIMLKIKDQ